MHLENETFSSWGEISAKVSIKLKLFQVGITEIKNQERMKPLQNLLRDNVLPQNENTIIR